MILLTISRSPIRQLVSMIIVICSLRIFFSEDARLDFDFFVGDLALELRILFRLTAKRASNSWRRD